MDWLRRVEAKQAHFRGPCAVESLESRVLFDAIPAPFQAVHVGTMTSPDQNSFAPATGTFTITETGGEFFGAQDSAAFVYQHLIGDGTIRARVTSVVGGPGVPALAPAGISIRSSLSPTAENVFVARRVENVVIVNSRVNEGGIGNYRSITPAGNPYWIQLIRTGQTITAQDSADGVNFTTLSTQTLPDLPADALAGLAVGSQTFSGAVTVTYDNVSITSSVASISGKVTDAKTSSGIPGRTVFLDTNQNGTADSGEPTAQTDALGDYSFGPMAAGTQRVAILLSSGEKSTPASGFQDVNTIVGATASNTDFTIQRVQNSAALPDLIGVFAAPVPTVLVSGKNSRASITVSNVGTLLAKGRFAITLFTSTTGSPDDASKVTLKTVSFPVKLKPGQGRTYRIAFKMPKGSVAGSSFLVAAVDPFGQIAEGDDGNNLVATAVTVQ